MARPVKPGSHLAIVAPAGPFDPDAFAKGVAWLETRYEISHSPDIFTKSGFLAGDDDRRFTELERAIRDPDIDAILCARGGYGATRLLPRLDPASIREADKLIVGFSDITALHAAWARAGVTSLHAPMVSALGGADEATRASWIEMIENPGLRRMNPLTRLDSAKSTSAQGIFRGGNLAVLGSMLGTPYPPPLKDAILFFEDVGERPYRIDRMLTTMTQAGWFDDLAGIVLGSFTEGDPGPDGVAVEDVFEEHFGDAPFPVLRELRAGHIDDNLAIPFGVPVRIDGEILILNP